nr:unnamed protein product [Spirometra erinaceieuropaei]
MDLTAAMKKSSSSYEPAQNTASSRPISSSASRCERKLSGCTIGRASDRYWPGESRGDPRAVYGPPIKATAPLLSVKGTNLLTERTPILQRCDEHFGGVLSRLPTIPDAAIARLPQVETNADLDLPPSTRK